MIRASDFLNNCYQTLQLKATTPKSNAKTLKTVKTPPKSPTQSQSS